MDGGIRMNPVITLTVLIVFIGVMSEIILRVLTDYTEEEE